MSKKIKKDIGVFIIIFLLTLIIFNQYITMHYATDTYNIMNIGYLQYAKNNSFIDGRIFMGILDVVANWVNLPINIMVIGFTVIALLVSSIAVVILKNMMLGLKNTDDKFLEIVAIVISYITIFNFMYVENLYFVEAIVMAFSILMYILAVKEIIQKNRFYYVKALIFSIIATFAYQGTIGLFVIYSLVFSIAKNKENKKEIIKDICVVISIVLISFVVNMIQINLATAIIGIEQKRLGGIHSLLYSIENVISKFSIMVIYDIILNSCDLFPKTLMVFYIIGILIISMIYEFKNKEERLSIKIISILGLSIIITTAMCIISLASYDTGRIHNNVGALIGLIFICMFCNSNIFIKNKTTSIFLTGILLTYVFITIVNTSDLLIQHKIVNKLEEEQCKKIEEYIQTYEKKHNIEVKEARYFKINNMKLKKGFFSIIPNKSVLTYNGITCTWSSIGTINFYTNRNFDNVNLKINENKDIFNEYLNQKNNGYQNNFVIIDGILYYTVFI